MKNTRKIVYCSRCGDEISLTELALLQGSTCALCSEMRLEADMIHAQRLKSTKPLLTVVGSVGINGRLPHPQS